MLDWHLGMVETEEGEPRMLGPADALTLARAWMVPLAVERPGPALFLAAGASDALDGPLASPPTRIGRDFDGIVDVCFTVAALRSGALPRCRRAPKSRRPPARDQLRLGRLQID